MWLRTEAKRKSFSLENKSDEYSMNICLRISSVLICFRSFSFVQNVPVLLYTHTHNTHAVSTANKNSTAVVIARVIMVANEYKIYAKLYGFS